MELVTGMTNSCHFIVEGKDCADKVGSGALPVLATPVMAAFMEKACAESIMPCLEDGYSSVGIKLSISHVSATPPGVAVSVQSTLTSIDGRKLVFHVEAYDTAGLIGEGTHERVIINNQKFLNKAEEKKKNHAD